jgi:NADPH-dependent curcumin reductase CurA
MSQEIRHDATRRTILKATLGTGVMAASGALESILSQAMAADGKNVIGPKTMNRQWLLRSYTEQAISPANFTYRELPLGRAATIKSGDVIVRNIIFAPLPSQRVRMRTDAGLGDGYFPPMMLGQPVAGLGVGQVVKSENSDFPLGTLVVSGAWEDYSYLRANQLTQTLPAGLDPIDYLSVYGLNAQTAYFGLTRVGDIKAGDTVVVSGASGSVGLTAVQIARINGCKVIGITGGKEKCERLLKDYRIHAAIDYKSENIAERVRELAPDGVNVYFDNVGGPIMQDVVDHMAKHGRVVLCGTISSYDSSNPAPGPRNMLRLVVYSVKMQGFIYSDFIADRDSAIAELRKWKEAGELLHKTDIRIGFQKLPETFMALFSGEKEGTLLLKNDDFS